MLIDVAKDRFDGGFLDSIRQIPEPFDNLSEVAGHKSKYTIRLEEGTLDNINYMCRTISILRRIVNVLVMNTDQMICYITSFS